MEPKIVSAAELERLIAQKREETEAEMRKIRRANGWQSAEEFLIELKALKFDPNKVYPWEKQR
jgi:hypothetical protein